MTLGLHALRSFTRHPLVRMTLRALPSFAILAALSYFFNEPGLIAFAVLGTGIMPSGAVGAELSAITRRAFIPRLVVNVGKATPAIGSMMANAQMASGGISSVVCPIQGAVLTTAQATDYSGAFNAPGDLVGITNGEFNLKAVVVPIPFFGMEGLVQMDAAVIPKIAAKMNDAGNQIAQYLSTQLFTNATNGTINIDGFPLQAGTGLYGNIDGATNTWWQGLSRNYGSVNPTRLNVLNAIVQATNNAGGECPNIGFMSPGTWVLLAQDFLPLEQYMYTRAGSPFGEDGGAGSQAQSAFRALMVGGVPIYIDFDMPAGQLLLYNTRYLGFYIHEAADFRFTGFASTLPNAQLGYIGVVIIVLENVLVNRRTIALASGFNSNSM